MNTGRPIRKALWRSTMWRASSMYKVGINPKSPVTGTIGKDVERVEVTGEGTHFDTRHIAPRAITGEMRDGERIWSSCTDNSSVAASL